MPVATTSMNPNGNHRRQLARQLWSDFRLYAIKARHGMQDRKTMALKDAQREWHARPPPGRSQQIFEQQRAEISKLHEKQHFLEMREEWQRILHSNGLQHEDWGEVTAQEMSVIRAILGPEELEADEKSHRAGANGGDSHNNPPPDFVPATTTVAAQPLSQSVSHQSQSSISSQSSFSSNNLSYAAPSLSSSRSQNTSSASYARIDPRYFTDDERDDYPNAFPGGRKPPGFAVGSDDEDGGIPIPSYKAWARGGQQQASAYPTNQGSSNQSSLSSSPADAPMSRSYHQPSSSLSSSAQFPPHVPSSLSKSVSANTDDDADRIFTSRATNGASSSSFSSSAAAAAAAAAAAKPKSKLRSGYIGPQFTTGDSENEADADFASMSKADLTAAYEKFKRETRTQKIREFHDEAAELDIEFFETINGGSNGYGDGDAGYDKAGIAQMIAQHEQDMLALRARKEEERKNLVDNERTRMKNEINKSRAGATTQKKGRGASSTIKGVSNTGMSSSTNPMSSSFNKTPVVPATKPKTSARSSPANGLGAMNLDGLQSVFNNAPDVDFDTAYHMSQLLQTEDDSEHNSSHDQQDWSTPQFNHHPRGNNNIPTTSNPAGPRKRTESISVLEESRFGTISAKNTKQRRGTITVSTAAAANDHNSNPNNGGFWKPHAQPPSPEQSQALTDQYAQVFFGGEAPVNRATVASRTAVRHDEDEDGWVGWNSKPAPRTNGVGRANVTNAGGATSAWTAKKPGQATPAPAGSSSPAMGASSGWGASVKKTFGFGGGNGGEWGEWNQENQYAEDFEQVEQGEGEEEEEEELVHPSPFSGHKKPSLLSDMMAKGKNVVAGAVGVAMGMNPSSPSIPAQIPNGPARKNSTATFVSTPPSTAPPTTTTSTGKKAAKKGRQVANKKATLVNQEDEAQELETQSHLTTPRAAASSTKYTSGFGSPSNNASASAFGFGSPTSRNTGGGGGGGMWDDMVSTTPRPGGMSNVFGGNVTAGPGSVRRPSGLHHQAWNADEEGEVDEEDEGEEDEDEVEEDERNMPGSLNHRGAGPGAGKFGWGMGVNAAPTKKAGTKPTSTASAWGRAPTTTNTATSSAMNSKKGSKLAAAKHHVTMEEIPDESNDPWNRSPSDFLASDSRVILEPKPNKPSTMFDDIIQFSTSPEDVRQRPTPTNKRGAVGKGANAGQEEEIYNQEWFRKAAMQLQQGTEQGNRIFGDQSAGGMKAGPPMNNNGINIPGRTGPGNASNAKSNNPWATSSSSPSGSFNDQPPFASGPPPKSSLNQAWGNGASPKPKVGPGIGVGKISNTKAKPTTGTSNGFGMGGGFGWGSGSPSVFGNGSSDPGDDENMWGEQNAEVDQEREEELLKSKMRLQEMFNDSTPSSIPKPAGLKRTVGGGPAARAKALREQKEREEREREEREEQEREAREQEREAREQEEREAREQEEREAREKEAQEKAAREAKEKEAAAAAAKPPPPKAGGAKKGKGKKR